MNGHPSGERGWPVGRWLTVIVILFGLQVLLAWRLSDRSPMRVREEARKLNARLLSPHPSPELVALLGLNNPTLFALPSRAGFSGGTWLEVRPLTPRPSGWSNPPQWLALPPGELLADFARFGATNQPERALVSDRLSRPQSARASLSPDFELPPGTRTTFSGELTANDLQMPLVFPVFEHPGLLAPTVLSVLVDQRGRVFQASLAPGGSSGSPAADQLALDHVRRAQFVPDPRVSPSRDARDFDLLRRGRITVRWWTQLPAVEPPPATPPASPTPQLQ